MRTWQSLGGMMIAAVLLLGPTSGCTISVQPWTKPHPGAPAPDAAAGAPTSAFKAPMPSPFPGSYPQVTPPPGGYPPNSYPPNPYSPAGYSSQSTSNESVAQLIKQLNETDDQRKALLDQVQTLKKHSRERDDNLQHASYEMEESAKQLKRTREEVRQFAGELDELRDRMRKLEEMRTALKPLIDEIMFHLEREKDAARQPRALAPAVSATPPSALAK